jgi:peptidyl-prolyl cis-trans isomerase B (cyclophilin B)
MQRTETTTIQSKRGEHLLVSPQGLAALFLTLALSLVWAGHARAGEPEKPDTGVGAMDAYIKANPVDKSNAKWKTSLTKPPKVSFDPSKKYYWLMDTNVGNMKIELLSDVAPMHVSSTIYLTSIGFYDDTIFHRVIPNFMAQGGDPLGVGTGSPGYKYSGEFSPTAKHDKPGILSMANAGPGTDGSQFFLTFVATPHLNGKHTVFGQVVEGKGTMKELEKFGSSPRGTTTRELKILKARIAVE